MNRMSFSETIFLFFLALVIFGPKKLPEIARQVGKALNEFKRASNEFKAQIEQEISNLEVENRQTILPPSAPPEGTASRSLTAQSSEAQTPSADTPAAAVSSASDDEPLFASSSTTGSAPDPTTSPTSQESHA